MSTSTSYTIKNTQGTLTFTIGVGSASGPLETQQNADLTFYGYGRTGWGQEVDQNFYRLLENFACHELTSSPATPKSKTELGGILGINRPVYGQLWYNKTTDELYICNDATANAWKHIISKEYADAHYAVGSGIVTDFVKLDGSNTPMTGYLVLNAAPRVGHPFDAATKDYVDAAIAGISSGSSTSYVLKTGDALTGGIIIRGGDIPANNTGTSYITNSGPYIVMRTTTNEGGVGNLRRSVIGLGATDGVSSTPRIDFHSGGGSIDYDSSIEASGGNPSVPGQGALLLTGYIVSDGRTPSIANQLVHKSWVESLISNAIASVQPQTQAASFPSGTRLLFHQASAPTGWTQDTNGTYNDRMIRVVSSVGGGVGGTHSPTIMNVVPNHTHTYTTGNMSANASHSHNLNLPDSTDPGLSGDSYYSGYFQANVRADRTTTSKNIEHQHSGTTNGNAGAGDWSPKYTDVIIGVKN